MISYTEENYLKALFNLANTKGEVTVLDVSKSLGLKMPTVNSMMKKLAEKKLVFYESYKPLKLTDKGKKEAGIIIRKHRLTEMYLVEKMGFGWDEVHAIAEQIEHIQAPSFFEKMDAILGYPSTDPHGSPIPDKNGKVHWIQYSKLSDCSTGDTVKISAVTNSSDEFLRFLNSKSLQLDLKIKVKKVEDFDGTIVIQFGNKNEETLSRIVCEKLLVTKL